MRLIFISLTLLLCMGLKAEPVRFIFDTDIGNDIDDAMALALIHELMDRGEMELLAVTISKDNQYAAPMVDLINTFYGRPDIPIGVVKDGPTPQDGKYNKPIVTATDEKGNPVYPHDLKSNADAPDATQLLREILANEADQSVVFSTVGFLTNAARLLSSGPDAASDLSGLDLIKGKIRLYVMMAGAFSPERRPEYNVHIDADASREVFENWPTPIVASGFEIGLAIQYPATSVERDFSYVPRHPVAEGYIHYMKMPYDRPTWDLTAVLYAVRPDRGYFDLSYPGRISLNDKNVTEFAESLDGRDRFLIANPEQIIRVRELLVQMVSSPPLN